MWVGGISQIISKEELEEEFCKFGKIEDFKFLRDRNTAFVEYSKMEDASLAMRSLNGKLIGGELIRVDFLRISKRVSTCIWNFNSAFNRYNYLLASIGIYITRLILSYAISTILSVSSSILTTHFKCFDQIVFFILNEFSPQSFC